MKLAFSTLGCPEWSLEQCVAAAQNYGYQGLELRLLDGAVIDSTLSAAERERVRSVCAAANMPIVCLDTSVKVALPDATEHAENIREAIAMIDLATEWNAPFIRVFAGSPEGTADDLAVDQACESFMALSDYAEQAGVKVLLETHDALCSSVLVARALAPTPIAAAGVLWDLLHPYRIGENPADTFARLKDRVWHVHIKDGRPREADTPDWELTLLGEGVVPTLAMLRMLADAGYNGWLSVEWEKKWHPELPAPEIALPQHIALLNEYLTKLT